MGWYVPFFNGRKPHLRFHLSLLAKANADKIGGTTVMSAGKATVVRGVACVISANVLHVGGKGVTLLIVLRLLDKIRIYGDRAHQRILAITFFIISVIQVKRASANRDPRVQISLAGGIPRLVGQAWFSLQHGRSPFLKDRKRRGSVRGKEERSRSPVFCVVGNQIPIG